MALVKKQFICSKEPYKRGTETKNAYFRIGELLTFKDDATGEEFHRVKLYLLPNETFVLFEDKKQGG